MFQLYIDESGQEQKDWMVVAGFLGDEQQWRNYVQPWADAIKPRKHLHMSSLRFKRESERLMLERAGAVPDLCKLIPVLGVVRYADYEDLVAGTADEKLFPGYIACCSPAVIDALRAIPPTERLEIVFEQQDRYEPVVNVLMKHIGNCRLPELLTTGGRPKLAKWSMVPKHTTTLLNASDYFCYALIQEKRDKDPVRKAWCQPILRTNMGRAYGKIFDRTAIREHVKEIQFRTLLDEVLSAARRSTK